MRSAILCAVAAAIGFSAIAATARPSFAQSDALLEREKTAFYADVHAKRFDAAVTEGALVLTRDPADDVFALDYAYALLAAGDAARGKTELAALAHSSDPAVASAAKAQLAADAGSGRARFDAFGYGLNESRFHDTFYGLDARYYLATTPVEPYVALHFSDDAKAGSVPANEILNDDAAVVSLGVRTKVSPIAYVFVEGGEAQSLLTGTTESDLRYGALLSTRLGTGGFKPQTQIDASITHFSRYVNTIAYADVTHNFYIGSPTVRGLIGTNLALDTNRAFYNNTLDALAGLQVHRGGVFTYRVFADVGTYLPRGIDPPVTRTYSSINLEVLFGYSH